MDETRVSVAFTAGQAKVFASELKPERSFNFSLCNNAVRFDDLEFKRWWMNTSSIYPTRKGQDVIHFQPLIDFWWACCEQDNSQTNRDICESLILANVLPNSRAHGSRRVFLDSKISTKQHSRDHQFRKETNVLLDSSKDQELTIMEFYEKVRDIVGPPEYSPELWKKFNKLKDELFKEPVAMIQRGSVLAGIELAKSNWDVLMRTIGRGRKIPDEKTIIDIFSYEARAAIHCCYSSLWEVIIDWLFEESCSAPHVHMFHHLWHRDITWPSNEYDNKSFHLLHGHILGLHPASGEFVETPVGQQLIAGWLHAAPKDWRTSGNPEIPQMCRLLHGLSIAFFRYQERHAARRDKGHSNTELLTRTKADDVVVSPYRGRRKLK